MAAIEIQGLSKRFGEITAVDDLSFSTREGAVTGFLGPNGAGKTTTLRMLLGLIAPTSGDIGVLGQPPGTPASLARVGSLIEGPAFYPYLSGRHNLRVVARYAAVQSREIDERVDRVLRTVELEGRADDKYTTYSLGMPTQVS